MELTPNERIALEIFTSETGAFSVVERIAKETIAKKREVFVQNTMNLGLETNEEIGEKFRGFTEGIRLVEAIFRDIGQFKKDKPPEQPVNRAR